jgi:predicted transcriptional regulator
MYVYLAAIRDKGTNRAKVTYDRLTEILGISRNEVSKAVSTLVSFELISVRLDDLDGIYGERPSNIYWLREGGNARSDN